MMEGIASEDSRFERLLWPAAALSLIAGVVHLFVSPIYLRQWWGYGFFFIIAGVLQISYALGIFVQPMMSDASTASSEESRRVMRAVYLAGAAGNAAIIILYVVTRTLGVPFVGPAANVVLPVTPLSLFTTLIELAEVVVLLGLARMSARPSTPAS